ncbi:hypothetical protein B0J13DRAFT_297192 [Dactylonectria estremocensis]|uniref:Uncharacterized protein n=1 Tax=Dactylonectria estremocensis TaxID=1079267 RepID=A0A9P9F0R9_9HYPO|nr:hypothetical protein B0J13DRAFT_297192 [Dactylonectria estremocensis]
MVSSKGLIPTYHLPPNFSIGPPPQGPIQLGSILNNLRDVKVLNSSCRLPIDEEEVFCHQKHGFTSTRSRMRKGELGVWARAVGFEGFGTNLNWSREKDDSFEYKFRRLDTFTFSPSVSYLRKSMKELDVAEYIEATDWAPVYIVTGLKVAVGPSVQRTDTTSFAATSKTGVHLPGGQIEIGPRIGFEGQDQYSESWETSDDFIFGLRVEKLVYKRQWLLSANRRDEGPLLAEPVVKGALVGADSDSDDDEDEDEIMKIEDGEVEGGMSQVIELDDEDEAVWTVPDKFI